MRRRKPCIGKNYFYPSRLHKTFAINPKINYQKVNAQVQFTNIALVCQYSSPKTPGLCYMKKVKEIRRRSKIDKKIEEEKEKEVEEGAIGEPELV